MRIVIVNADRAGGRRYKDVADGVNVASIVKEEVGTWDKTRYLVEYKEPGGYDFVAAGGAEVPREGWEISVSRRDLKAA